MFSNVLKESNRISFNALIKHYKIAGVEARVHKKVRVPIKFTETEIHKSSCRFHSQLKPMALFYLAAHHSTGKQI